MKNSGGNKMNKRKDIVLDILIIITFVLSVLSLALGSSIILVISATLMAVCILLTFINKGNADSGNPKIR